MILTVTANPAVDIVYFVDEFIMGEVHRPANMTYTAGGKGLNVSRVATILGEDVTAMGFVGGHNGEFIKSEISKLGINNRFTQINGETRRCVNITEDNGKSGEILESGPRISADEEKAFIEAFSEEVKNADIVCISGSLPGGLDSRFYCKLVEITKENGKKCIVDTSGKTLEDVISAKPYMIKPNKYELSVLLGCEIENDDDVKNALKMLYKKGVEIPFVTLGGEGAMAYDGNEFYKFSIPSVEIKNTVGSGDSTVAGTVVGISRGMSLSDSIRLGMAAGTANTQYRETGMVSRELVEKYYKETKAL